MQLSNISRLSIIRTISSFSIYAPIITFFFQDHGLHFSQIFLLQSVMSVAVFLFEVPTGYYGDRYGKAKSLYLGSIITAIGFIIYSLGDSFFHFACCEVIIALGYSFTSGSDSALLYDTLKQEHRESEYKRTEGKISSYSEISAIFGSVLGSLLAHYIGNNYVFLSYGCILLFIIPLCYGLKDYATSIQSEDKQLRKNIASIVRMSLHDHPTLKRIILYGSIISTATYIIARASQPYLLEQGLALIYIGIALALLKVVISIASSHAHTRDHVLGWKLSLSSLLLLVILGYIICGLANGLLVGFCGLILFQIERGLHKPIFNHAINELVNSEIRATVLSVNSMIGRFFYATIGPIIGFISDTFSLKVMLLCCVAIFTILGIWSYMNIKKI